MAAATKERAENIALLYLLHSVPLQPHRNSIGSPGIPHGNYTLSFEEERAIVGTLAFLSAMKDDSNYIPAICLQENFETRSLLMLATVNKVSRNDGNQRLADLKKGFERLFQTLSSVSDAKSTAIEHDIYAAIIFMCERRILARLRLIKGRQGARRKPFGDVLQIAMEYLRGIGIREGHKFADASMQFVNTAKPITKSLNGWSKHQTVVELELIVKHVFILSSIHGLSSLIDLIPDNILAPSAKKNLLNIILKVARYQECATFLYLKSRKLPLLRRLRVLLPELPEEWFVKTVSSTNIADLQSIISRAGVMKKTNLNHLCRLLGTTELAANNKLKQQTKATLHEAKIHAEIQLLLYLKLKASAGNPRIICSSKDACFLCHAFIHMHGKIHVPGSHGRLYPGWRLPGSGDFRDLEVRFNIVLRNMIKNSIVVLMQRQRKTIYPDPNESTLLTLRRSVSTLLAPSTHGDAGEIARTTSQPEISPHDRIDINSSSSRPSSPAAPDVLATNNDPANQPILVKDQIRTPHSQKSDITLLSSAENSIVEIKRDPVEEASANVQFPSCTFQSEHINILIEPPDNLLSPTSNRVSPGLQIVIQTLTRKEKECLERQHEESIVDVKTFPDGSVYQLDAQDCMYLKVRKAVIRVGIHLPV